MAGGSLNLLHDEKQCVITHDDDPISFKNKFLIRDLDT